MQATSGSFVDRGVFPVLRINLLYYLTIHARVSSRTREENDNDNNESPIVDFSNSVKMSTTPLPSSFDNDACVPIV